MTPADPLNILTERCDTGTRRDGTNTRSRAVHFCLVVATEGQLAAVWYYIAFLQALGGVPFLSVSSPHPLIGSYRGVLYPAVTAVFLSVTGLLARRML